MIDNRAVSIYDPFAADYDAWADHMTDDIGWYVGLAEKAAEPIVELAVGTGRVAIPIARETGKRVIGFDSSRAMLEIAERRAAGLPIELHLADMRDFAVDGLVDLIICPFRSLLHLPTWRDRRRVFDRVAAVLRPGGRFAWNAFVFSAVVAVQHEGERLERRDGLWEEAHYVAADSRIELTRGRGDKTFGTLSLWWATKAEWEGLIDAAGLEVASLNGGFRGEPFTDDSGEFVWIARKPQ